MYNLNSFKSVKYEPLNVEEMQKVKDFIEDRIPLKEIYKLMGNKKKQIINSIITNSTYYSKKVLGTHLGHKSEPYYSEKEMLEEKKYNTYSLSDSEKEILFNSYDDE